MLLERIGVGPLGDEGGVCGLGGDKSGVEVSGGKGAEEEGIWQGEDAVVIVDAGVMVRATGQSIGAVGGARLMDEADVVVAEREDIVSEATVDFLGAAVILEVLVIGKDVDEEFGSD